MCAKKSLNLKCFLLIFPFLSQLDGSSKRRRIKLNEVMDIDNDKNYLDRTVHKCNQCEYTSSQGGHLRTHLKTHSGEKSNKCNQCNFASSYTSALRTRLKTHSNLRRLKIHSGEKINKCNHCPEKYGLSENLQ